MKKVIVSLLIIAAFVVAPVSLFAQFSGNASSRAKAQIVTAISVDNDRPLDFGTILKTASGDGGTVVVAGTDNAFAVVGLGSFTLGTGTSSSARFAVGGSPNATYTVTIPSDVLTLAPALGASTNTTVVTVDPFTSSIEEDGVLSDVGTQSFYVGGTLIIPADAVADYYSASFDVTVAYN